MIGVSLPATADFTVAVYNVQGRQVALLADAEPISPGQHAQTFDASNLANGMYLVRASVPGEVDQVQKLMLIR